jgi:hypothetical protein
MGGFMKAFLKAGLGLTSATVLIIGFQIPAAKGEALKPGAVLLAQSAETKNEKEAVPSAPSKEPGQSKSKEPSPSPKKQKKSYKFERSKQPPAAVRTKKFGGTTMRGKKTSEGE